MAIAREKPGGGVDSTPPPAEIGLTVTLLNNSVELSSNLDPEPLTEWIENSTAHPIF